MTDDFKTAANPKELSFECKEYAESKFNDSSFLKNLPKNCVLKWQISIKSEKYIIKINHKEILNELSSICQNSAFE